MGFIYFLSLVCNEDTNTSFFKYNKGLFCNFENRNQSYKFHLYSLCRAFTPSCWF